MSIDHVGGNRGRIQLYIHARERRERCTREIEVQSHVRAREVNTEEREKDAHLEERYTITRDLLYTRERHT